MHDMYRGSLGLPVVDKLVILHQDSTNEFSPFLGRVSPDSRLTHGFLMR